MEITTQQILQVLSTVEEPDLKKDIVTLGMVTSVDIDGKHIHLTIKLTTPACPLQELIRSRCIETIQNSLGKDLIVTVNMIADVTSSRKSPILPGVKNIVAIASGKGGVGKSTVTSHLALALAKSGAKVGIIDADIFGPSIPTMFACEGARPGVVTKNNGKHFLIPVEQYGIKLLSIGFLASPEDAVVWRGPMASSALKQFMTDAEWGELDYLLIDLPPGTSDIHLTLVQTVSLTGAVIVTTPQKVALSDAQKAISMFKQKAINVPILGIIENMAYFTPAELPNHRYYIFGKDGGKVLARRHEVPFLGEIPLVQSIREAGDNGKPLISSDEITYNAFWQIAQTLAQQIAIRNAEKALEAIEKQ
ncbi:MAG: Mrp/NBP35 family ATP-binding protein [Cytophagales bacterium]|nr:Mrp/NBP35 family ATP-binding protein [Cytophagales bacterium]MDW8383918.1 Mrp/NBP35 family ATP-binding protein [Flammeovirgaceae bacterium]